MPLGNILKSKEEIKSERDTERDFRRANRSCERLQVALERQVKDLENELKKAAAKNDTASVKVLALQLARLRKEKARAQSVKSKVDSITSHAKSIQMNQTLGKVMASSAASAGRINQSINLEGLSQQANQFQAETSKLQMKDDILESAFDDLFNDSEEEIESDAIMNQFLDEIGVDISNAIPISKPLPKVSVAAKSQETDAELNEKFNKLRSL